MKKLTPDSPLAVPLISTCMLLLLSLVPWHDISDGGIRDFSLFEDLKTEKTMVRTTEIIDPHLEEAMLEITADEELPVIQLSQGAVHDDVRPEDQALSSQSDVRTVAVGKIDGIQPLEDYTPHGSGLAGFAQALSESGSRFVRIAVIGDSYIEGDIFTQDIRRLLQESYGGRGVGYMSMHSDFPGFRRSVVQSDANWTVIDMRNVRHDSIRTIAGEYCAGTSGSQASFKGAKGANVSSWSRSRLLFISPSDGVIRLSAAGNDTDFEVRASSDVQCLTVDGETSAFRISSDVDGLKVLGAWLEDAAGVGVDCMSLRGNSGISHRSISPSLASSMSEYVGYDLIIVEYGMNALSSEQTEYSSYGILMSKVIARLRACYPKADIIMLGVGDRGQKNGSEVVSLPTIDAMIDAQRECARREAVIFWDVRAAMGGENSVVDWRKRGLVNADYIHLNHKGGSVLAEEFVKALNMKTKEY